MLFDRRQTDYYNNIHWHALRPISWTMDLIDGSQKIREVSYVMGRTPIGIFYIYWDHRVKENGYYIDSTPWDEYTGCNGFDTLEAAKKICAELYKEKINECFLMKHE